MKKIDVSNPLALSKIIASEGLTNQIPADASSVAEQYNASQDVGFPEVTMKPVEIGGEAPDGRDFNGFLQLLSSHLFASQNGGIYTFNADVSSAIGGYPQGAILGYIDTNGDYNFVKSLIDDNTYNFVTNPEYIDNIHWERIVYPGAANTDLSNLTLQGKNIANWSSNVSNCITKIPQDIKLELNNGTLTLKAGSKVYVPNGSGVFDEYIVTSDVMATRTVNGTYMAFLNQNKDIDIVQTINAYSGASQPTGIDQYSVWYNTTNNIVKKTGNAGSSWINDYSLPICIFTVSNNVISSIDKVFNGFGYIGSSYYYLPDVEVLIPDGRNIDGTLKNIKYTTTSVKVNTLDTSNTFNDFKLRISYNGNINVTDMYYDEANNINIHANGQIASSVICGSFSAESGKIRALDFQIKTPFHAVDYSDFKTLSESVPNLQQVNVLPVSPDANTWYAIPE